MQLYKIAEQYNSLLALDADDIPDNVVADTLEALTGEFDDKAGAIAHMIANLSAESAAVKEAIKTMNHRQKVLENRAESLKQYLKDQMTKIDRNEIKTPYVIAKIKKNPPSVIIDDETILPDEFKKVIETIKINKTDIKKALVDSYVPGAHIEQTMRLEVK